MTSILNNYIQEVKEEGEIFLSEASAKVVLKIPELARTNA